MSARPAETVDYWLDAHLKAWGEWVRSSERAADLLGCVTSRFLAISNSSDFEAMCSGVDTTVAEAVEAIVRHELQPPEAVALEKTYVVAAYRFRRQDVAAELLDRARAKVLAGLRRRHVYCGE